ncbi:MAG: hypothetical protein H0X52_01305 [Gemmatimonadetes bacterium]|nr:hypothetical protein [Gemmatimonadota bacterium]
MRRDLNAAWKALSLRRPFVLSLLLATNLQALLFLLLELPQSGGEVPLGGILAVALLLASGAGLARYVPRWMNGSEGEDTASQVRAASTRSLVQRVLGAALVLLVGAYLLVLTVPQPLFPYRLSYRSFTVHSDQPLSRGVYPVLDRAQARLASSAVYDSTALHTIFLSSSYWKFALFAREHFRAFGIRSPLRGHIFISKADPERDVVVRYAEAQNERRLSGVIAHEVTHNLLQKATSGRELPRWKEEGYADYVAGESTFDYGAGVRLLAEGRSEGSSAFRYLKYRLLVEYLLEEKGVPFEEFLRIRVDPCLLEAELVRRMHAQNRAEPAEFN